MSTTNERVAAGAALLDEKRPGWWQRIDTDTLDMGETCGCILGQTYEANGRSTPFDMGCVDLFGSKLGVYGWVADDGWDAATEHGFSLGPQAYEESEWAELRAAWVALIEARRAAPEVA